MRGEVDVLAAATRRKRRASLGERGHLAIPNVVGDRDPATDDEPVVMQDRGAVLLLRRPPVELEEIGHRTERAAAERGEVVTRASRGIREDPEVTLVTGQRYRLIGRQLQVVHLVPRPYRPSSVCHQGARESEVELAQRTHVGQEFG